MIYLDNSATTFPKPFAVREACALAVRTSANPGRSGHEPSLRAAGEIFRARQAAAELFNAPSENSVVFTHNCTAALNTVIKGLLKSGDHVIVSELEHNAVMRPIESMKARGVSCTAVKVYPADNDRTVDSFRQAITIKTRLIVCAQASNVWGIRLPVERLAALAHEYGLLIAVDAAQSAGVVPIDIKDSGIDYLCVAGHKGLYGPMSAGMLIVGSDRIPEPLTEGGTGSYSLSFMQPAELPDRLESGTPDVSGIAGLRAGMDFVRDKGIERIAAHEFMLIRRLYRGLRAVKGIELYLPEPEPRHFVPILSFNFTNIDSETAAGQLGRYGIAVRAGLHCSPAAHRAFGTQEKGAVRISPSVFTTAKDIDTALYAIKRTASS